MSRFARAIPSLPDLQKAKGDISPPSFYAAFGSKDALFREVVTLYQETMGDDEEDRAAGATSEATLTLLLSL